MSMPAHARESPRVSLEGRTLEGRYKIEERLGEGGLGTVYRAQHLKLARSVAIKVLREELRAIPQIRARFEREVRALSSLSHPNIITITDFGISDGMPFLVMELAPGSELSKLVGKPMPVKRALWITRQILSSLAYAHDQDVVHRDLKPANVIVRTLPDGRDHAIVLDYGLAKFVGEGDPSADLTRSGLVVGTPAYMPPEQMAAGERKAEARSDLYSTGLILFELLTGRRPFLFEEPAELLRAHLVSPPPTLAEALPGSSVDPRLEVLVSRALAKAPSDRFASARAMIDAIDALPEEPMLLPGMRPSRTVPEETRPSTKSNALQRAPRRPTFGDWLLRFMVVVLTFSTTTFGIMWFVEKQAAERANATIVGEAPVQRVTTASPTSASPERPGPPAAVQAVVPRPAPEAPVGALVPIASAVEVPGAVAVAEEGEEEAVADIVEGQPELEVVEPTQTEEPIEDGLEAPPPEAPEPALTHAPSAGPRPPARNLLRGRLPGPLARVRDRLERRRTVGRGDLNALVHYRNKHGSDPRARLLIGHSYMQRSWLSAALDQYERAYALDQSSRGDPNMLANIVRIVRIDSLEQRARAMVLRMYGREAHAAVSRALERTRDDDEQRRLRNLLSRI